MDGHRRFDVTGSRLQVDSPSLRLDISREFVLRQRLLWSYAQVPNFDYLLRSLRLFRPRRERGT